ncbi:MAG TPA: peptidase, partial [Thermoanaerobaculia bacterium]|nr:peptidase [Thermoanaerobaculia bacterium]
MRRSTFLALLFVLLTALPSVAAPPKKPAEASAPAVESIAQKTAGMERRAGLLTIWLDRKAGKVWLEVPPAKAGSDEVGSYLYADTLRTGLGSNPVGLDRGQLGVVSIVILRRMGGRLLIEQPNLGFRALSENPEEIQAVRESFATSVIWAGEIAAEDPD